MPTIVQSVATSVNSSSSISQSITSTASGNLLLIACQCTNNVVTLTISTTGTSQTFTQLVQVLPGSGQLVSWYVPNCASGTTGITVTRSSGSGQFSMLILEVSGIATSPLDKQANSTAVGDTGTTAITTQANEFWWGLFSGNGNSNGSAVTFSGLSSGWTPDVSSTSTATGVNNNTGIFDCYQITTTTGTANATITTGNIASNGNCGAVFTFTESGGVVTAVKMQAIRGWSYPI